MVDKSVFPTESFLEAFCDSDAIVAECSCGVTYFAGSCGDIEQVDLQSLQVECKSDPEAYIDTGVECQSLVDAFGQVFVVGCPCGKLVRIEQVIWADHEKITRYFKARARAEFNRAKGQLDIFRDLGVPSDG